MSSAIRRVGWMAGAVLAITCAVSIAAWAGGSGFGDDDDNSEEEGPSYFGFVRDASGATVPDAKVTVGVKNRGGVVTRGRQCCEAAGLSAKRCNWPRHAECCLAGKDQ